MKQWPGICAAFTAAAAPQALPATLGATAPAGLDHAALVACTADPAERLLAGMLLVVSTLQRHFGLLERVAAGRRLALPPAPRSPAMKWCTKLVGDNCPAASLPWGTAPGGTGPVLHLFPSPQVCAVSANGSQVAADKGNWTVGDCILVRMASMVRAAA